MGIISSTLNVKHAGRFNFLAFLNKFLKHARVKTGVIQRARLDGECKFGLSVHAIVKSR